MRKPRKSTKHSPWHRDAAQEMVTAVAIVIFLIFSSVLRYHPHFNVSEVRACLIVNMYTLDGVFCSIFPQEWWLNR